MAWNLFKKKTATSTPDDQKHPAPIHSDTSLSPDFLQKLIPIGELPVDELQKIPFQLRHFTPGAIIFHRGECVENLMYLHSGEVFLEMANGNGQHVADSTFKACYPLSGQNEHRVTAIAKTNTSIIYLPLSTLQHSADTIEQQNPLTNYNLVPRHLRNSAFFNSFRECYRQEKLHIPTLPDIAVRLRSAIQKDILISDAVKIINLDPVIAAKLIQVANSSLYVSPQPLTSCHDAVTRLGLQTTQNLVTSMSLKNLFRSNSQQLNAYIQQLWKQSIQIASLSYILAKLSTKINPDQAMLAGLVHNIGALPIVTHAESLEPEAYTLEELQDMIATLQGHVGQYLLQKWSFPENLLNIPRQTHYWYHDEQPTLQISDIVLLAKYHSLLGPSRAESLPPIDTLPAFTKLGEFGLTPDMSLQVLQDAKQQIAEALQFFKG